MTASPSPLVYKITEHRSKNAGRLVLFFCPFGIPSWQLALPGMPIWRLVRAGYNVVAYSYGTAIATVSPKVTIDNMDAIIADADNRILNAASDIAISCFGTSMGTVLAANIAVRHPRIKKVILNLSYADISDHIIGLPNMRTIPKKRLQKYLQVAGHEPGLRKAFDSYSPINLTDGFTGKKVLLYAAKGDRILKLADAAQFQTALRRASVDLQYHENVRGGHYASALVNYLQYRRYLQFLDSGTNP